MKINKLVLIIFVLSVLIVGCQEQPHPVLTSTPTAVLSSITEGYPSPQQPSGYSAGYPAPTIQWTTQTAFQSYPVALAAAKKWNPKAGLYQIPATFRAEMNFGRSKTGEGWFFMFKLPESPLEYYVYVSNGEVLGTTEAQPIIFGKAPFEFQAIPELNKLLDTDKLLNLYDQNGGLEYKTDNPKAVLNPELNFLTTDSFPFWRIYDASTPKVTVPLFTINALTGEILPNN